MGAWVPIPDGRGRPRAAPCGIGPWDGARVASQQSPTLRPGRGKCSTQNGSVIPEPRRGDPKQLESARLFDRSCRVATRDPSRLGQLESARGCAGLGQPWPRPAARRSGWSGPHGEEFALDKSASARTDERAEPPTAIAGGTLRRNVLGAIALEKNDCSFPRRRQPRRGSNPGQRRRPAMHP